MGYRAVGTNIASKLKTKRTAGIGVLILIGGLLALTTEAQFQPRAVRVDCVIDGDGGSTAGPNPTGSVGLQPFFLDQCKRITGTGS